jgi:hypothetical protein
VRVPSETAPAVGSAKKTEPELGKWQPKMASHPINRKLLNPEYWLEMLKPI